MRIALLRPPRIAPIPSATPEYVSRSAGCLPPLGLLYLHAAVVAAGHEAVFLDGELEGWNREATVKAVLEARPEIVGFQVLSPSLPDACRIAEALKETAPHLPILFGGPHASHFPEETARLPYVDFVLVGECEHSLPALLTRLEDPAHEAVVPGLVSTEKMGSATQPPDPPRVDLDSLPLPARATSRHERYTSILAEANPATTMITSRGCPFRCTFCSRASKSWRAHGAEFVLAEFEAIAALGIRDVFLHDDNFAVDRERVEAICEGLVARKLDLVWEARTHVHCVDAALLGLMARAGCRRLSFGVESGSPRVLEALGKELDLGRVGEVFAACRKVGIATLADFMLGCPAEEEEDVGRTLDLARRIAPDYVQFNILTLYPGTDLLEGARRKGIVRGTPWRTFAEQPLLPFEPPLWTEHFTRPELEAMTARAYRSFYFRPGFLVKQLGRIHSLDHFAALARAAFRMLKKDSQS